jgi:hypothetical protein
MSEIKIHEVLASVHERRWSDDEIEALTPGQLKEFIIACYPARKVKDPELKVLYEAKKPSAADKTFASKVSRRSQAEREAHFKTEEAVQSQGGSQHYTMQEAKVTIGLQVLTRPNTPIPVSFQAKEERKHVQAIAPFCAQIMKLQERRWVLGDLTVWKKTLGESIDVTEVQTFGALLLELVNADSSWVTMADAAKSSVTGASMLVFVRDVLNRTSQFGYEMLHTMFVCNILRSFVKVKTSYYVRMLNVDNATAAVKSECYERNGRKLNETEKSVLRGRYPGLFYYKGGFLPEVVFPKSDGTLESAELNLRRLREFSMGEDTALMLLSGMKGYSGLCTRNGKKFQFILGATLAAWKRRRFLIYD